VSPQHITEALALEDIDELGLRPDDRAVLEVLCKQFKGKPVGVENLAASVGVEQTIRSAIFERMWCRATPSTPIFTGDHSGMESMSSSTLQTNRFPFASHRPIRWNVGSWMSPWIT
jgi:hypothetical protein